MDNLKKAFGRFKWDIIIISVLTVALGVICVIMPETSGDVLSLIFGILMICVGLTLFVKYIVYGGFLFGGYILIPALSLLAFGIFCVVNPRLLQGMLTVLLGIYIVVDSSVAVSETVLCAREGVKGWFLPFVLAVISMGLGVVVMFSEFDTVVIFAGVSLIIEGVRNIVTTAVFGKKIREAKKRIVTVTKIDE